MSMPKVTCMYVVYYTMHETAIQVAKLKGKGDTALFYRDKALKKLKLYFQKRWWMNVLKYVKLLHDNAHLHNDISRG